MVMKRFMTSAVVMAAVAAAMPFGRTFEKRDPVTTITLTMASTYTTTLAHATPATPTTTSVPDSNAYLPHTDDNWLGGHCGSSNCGGSSGSSGPGGLGDSGGLGASGGSRLPGVSYAPFRADHQCKTKDEIMHDMARLAEDYSLLRIYGTECDQVANVYSCAKSHGMKVFLGIWDIDDVQAEAQKIIDGIAGDWSIVDTISVGNELVNQNIASPAKVIAALKQARALLRGAGYQGPVVTVDTFVAANANPELCTESDYCAVNAHAFFDPNTSAEEAGKWLSDTVEGLRSKIPGNKRIVVCETGWPTQGNANGKAVPGMDQQKAALGSIQEAFADHLEDLILFSAFDDLWKKAEAATFMAEQHWGIGGRKSSSN
ncbi:hypothetical protein FAVG1_03008 [Fusarium avenaceum]|nr:hypothetical protein FAVG1_03008 [Fusarium avenaceum]